MIHELGLEHRFVLVDLLAGEHLDPEFLRVNPNARVPAIEDEGFALWESNAIVEYLAEKHRALIPADFRERARVRQWLSWQAAHFFMPLESAFLCKFLPALGVPYDTSNFQRYADEARPYLKMLDGQLAERSYLVGETFTIADIAVGITASLCEPAGIDTSALPHLNRWVGLLAERPAFQRCRLRTL
jgi:glutathione S-transferase